MIRIFVANHYLDHAGATLYSERQMRNVYDSLSTNLYCNPHTSKSTEDLIDQVRYKILQHFNTTSNEYSVVFVSGATAALKTVAETFDFGANKGAFVYVRDAHTSVLGMRESVQTDNIRAIERTDFLRHSVGNCGSDGIASNSLCVYAAQCNFGGYKYPLELIENVQRCANGSNWYVCLDAASYVSTNHLDLNKYRPDFVCISFYKMFGYPTGLGGLLVSKRGESVLRKRYYGGGTVKIAMSGRNWHEKRDCFHER